MNWTTIIWSISSGVCLALAGVHLFVWLRIRDNWINLAFSLWAMAVAFSAVFELAMMDAQTTEQYGELVRWIHIPLGVATIGYVLFVRLYLQGGRRWLMWSICGVAVLQMSVNFMVPKVNFSELSSLKHIPMWGDMVAVPVGMTNPWEWIGRVSAVLILLFIVDATIKVWRQGQKRKTLMIGVVFLSSSIGSIAFSSLLTQGDLPVTVSLPSLPPILLMAYELSTGLLRARQVAQDLQQSQERMSLAARAANLSLWEWDIIRDEFWVTEAGRARVGVKALERVTFGRLLESIHPDERESFRQAVRRTLEDDAEFRVEYRVGTPADTARWTEARGQVDRKPNGKPLRVRGVSVDITERKQLDNYRKMGHEILRILSEPENLQDSLQRVLAAVKASTGVDAVGVRLQDKDDYPYFYQKGFSKDFLHKENSLLKRERDGGICRDSNGKVCLECICGLVISGNTDPSNPQFTRGGSAWTNDSSQLLDLPAHQDPRTNPRNECIHQGYASVALVPIRAKGQIVGLLQLNDHKKGRFTLETVQLLEGIAENIGEAMQRRQAEEALKESEERLKEAQRIAYLGNWELNLLTNKLIWSDEIFRIFEIDKERFGASYEFFLSTVHPDDREAVNAAYTQSLSTRKSYAITHRLLMPDGRFKYVQERCETFYSAEGKPLRSIGTVQDITERKKSEQAIIEAEKRYRTVADFTYDWEYWEAPDNEILYMSPSCERVTGYNKDEFIACPRLLEDIIVPEDKNIWAAHRHEPQDKNKLLEIEFRIMKKDGSIRWIEHICQPVFDENGEFSGHRVSNRDVTLRKENREALQKSQKSLQYFTGKLITIQEEERRRLAREMHDDLTQRLALLAIDVSKLEIENQQHDSPMRTKLQDIKKKIIKLSKDIHDISRQIHPAILDDLGLVDAIKSECATFSQREEIHVEYEANNVPSSIPKNVAICIYRITQESLRNIAKYAKTNQASVSLVRLDGNLILTVRDNGIGFDITHGQSQKGIGLTSMQERARLIQGEFSVQSKPGEGTTVKVIAPYTKEQE